MSLMRTCKEVAARLSQGLEEPIPLGERMTLRMHMMMCKYCARYFNQIRSLRALARGYEAVDDPDVDARIKLSPEARERIAEALAKALAKAQQESTEP